MESLTETTPPAPEDESKETESSSREESSSGPEDLSSQDSELQTLLADEIRLRQFTEDVLDSRQQELEAQELRSEQLSQELETSTNLLRNTQIELADARNQAKAKEKQLQDVKDQVFRLQPQRKDITEAEAQDSYRSLHAKVQRWVENRLRPTLDDLDSGRLRMRPTPPKATRFMSLLRIAGRRRMNVDQTDEYHVIAVIMQYLWLALFGRPFYCPLDDDDGDATITWIDEVGGAMSRSGRDIGQCREWRSETLAALTSQVAFRTRRARYLTFIAQDLASILSAVITKASLIELQGSLHWTIIEPAAALAHQLHLAPTIFSLKWPARHAWSRLEVYECINLASGGLVLDLSGTGLTSPARRKVSYLFDVAPGLFVERIECGKKMAFKAISKPRVLVWGGDAEVIQKPTIVRWLWDRSNEPQGPLSESSSGATTPRRSFGQQHSPGRR